jgi:pentatricopeptide repeat-containing protein PET309
MLERTAGCLESGSLRRLLPSSKKSLKSRRTLHSAFWNHGAGDLELSPLWAALVRGPDAVEKPQQNSTGNGGMLLDFLYPAGTINFLRQYSGWGVDRQDGRRARAGLAKLGQRLYTSSAKGTSSTDQATATDTIDEAAQGISNIGNVESLTKLMGLMKTCDYEGAWRQYLYLEGNDQQRLRRQLIEYLSTSNRIVDAERITDLFEMLGPGERDSITYKSGIRAYLRLRNLSDAIKLHREVLENLESLAGSDELLAYTIDNSLWSHAFRTWTDVQTFRKRHSQLSYNIFSVLYTLPNLGSRAFELAEYVNRRREASSCSSEASSSGLLEFASKVVRRVLLNHSTFEQPRFLGLLGILQQWNLDSPALYDEAVQLLLYLNQSKLAVKCYRSARRDRDIKFTRPMLHAVLKVFCNHHSVLGMQQVLEDFYRFYSKPTRVAYKMCMSEFAAQGDAATVHALFDQYTSRFVMKGKPLLSAGDVAPILHVHTRRGEFAEVIKAFDEIEEKYGLHPDLRCWNILIHAYGKVHDIDNAFKCFEKVLDSQSLRPDDYTFGTVMGICVARGDLERTVEVYRLANELGIEKGTAMVDCLVLAHVQDDRLQQAENICEDAIDMKLKGSRTRMWNYLLVAYAMRRDLNSVNRLLRRMSEVNVDYDEYTYSSLMQALVMVKQPDRAYSILQDVMPEAGIRATSFHYAVVMGGYLANGEIQKVFHVQNRLVRRGVRKSASSNLLIFKAAAAEDQKSLQTGTAEQKLQRAIQIFQDVVSSINPHEIPDTTQKGTGRTPRDISYTTMFYNYFLFVLGQLNKFETVKELYEKFKNTLPPQKRGTIPVEILSALMNAKLRERDYKGVQECWDLAVAQAKEQGRPLPCTGPLPVGNDEKGPEAAKILPVHQLDLANSLTTYMNSIAIQSKIDDLPNVVEILLKDGFLLDNNNWNQYIQLLTRKLRWKLAFETCESMLMDGWTGWARLRWQRPERNRLPMEIRTAKKEQTHYRPKYHTLLYLARALLELQAMAAESRASQFLLNDLERKCSRTVQAIKSMQRTDDALEREVLRGY